MYLAIVSVPGEREDRVKLCQTQTEAADYVMKLKQFKLARDGMAVSGKVFRLGEPTETF